MTPDEHYAEAEALLKIAKAGDLPAEKRALTVAMAHVHATLATRPPSSAGVNVTGMFNPTGGGTAAIRPTNQPQSTWQAALAPHSAGAR
jgi:hypothetical protein